MTNLWNFVVCMYRILVVIGRLTFAMLQDEFRLLCYFGAHASLVNGLCDIARSWYRKYISCLFGEILSHI